MPLFKFDKNKIVLYLGPIVMFWVAKRKISWLDPITIQMLAATEAEH
jgi:hypothetical protein